MKRSIIFIISGYQTVMVPIVKNLLGMQDFCRYSPSCSEYTKQQIIKHGIIKGVYRGFMQLLSCHPYKISEVKLQISKANFKR